MLNILLVDDVKSNLGVLTLHIEEWLEDKEIDEEKYIIDTAENGQIAVDMVQLKDYDMIFLDIMMPVMDGLLALKTMRELNLTTQPNIIMATALEDAETKQIAKHHKANAYVTKPISFTMVTAMMNRYVDLSELTDDEDFEEDFFDLDDFDDFDDFENEESNTQKDMMDKFNASHKKISATEFLKDYPDLNHILEDIADLDADVGSIIEFLDEENIPDEIDTIVELLSSYAIFLNTFVDFFELSTSLTMLGDVLDKTDFSNLTTKNKMFISSITKALLQDLQDWKDHVFIEQDTVDVFYINASSLSTCIQLESYIKTNS